jgi:hypothetical protein
MRCGDAGHAERPFDIGTIYEGFHWITDFGADKIKVHAKFPGTQHYNEGDYVTKSAWNHFHESTLTQDGWKPEWCVSDPNKVIYTSESGVIYPYNELPEYQNLDAVTGLIINNKSMKIIGQFKCKNNNALWNVRELPNSSSNDIGDLIPNTEWIATAIEIQGEPVNGTTIWLQYQNGWVSGSCLVSCEIIGDIQCPANLEKCLVDKSNLQAELSEAKKTISEKVIEINNLKLDIKHLQEVILNLEMGNKTYSWSEILNLIFKKLSGKI